MTVLEIAKVLQADVLVKGDGADKPVRNVVSSDLMSDVLVVDDEDILLLTSLASEQVLRTAQIVGALGVVLVNGKPMPSSMINVANDLRITLASSRLSKYDACIAVHEALKEEAPPA